MTTANRVHETSTTTGTGNLTLAGAVSNFQTFNSGIGLLIPFAYWIDNESGQWEGGIGYLSDSTTLVRDLILDNSSGTKVALSFTGTLQVFANGNAFSRGDSFTVLDDPTTLVNDGLVLSKQHSVIQGSETNFGTDKIFYTPHYHNLLNPITRISAKNGSTTNGILRLGIYSMKDGLPYKRLVQTGDITAVAFTQYIETIAPPDMPTGWYFVANIHSANNSLITSPRRYVTNTCLGVRQADPQSPMTYVQETVTSWTEMPATASPSSINYEEPAPRIFIG